MANTGILMAWLVSINKNQSRFGTFVVRSPGFVLFKNYVFEIWKHVYSGLFREGPAGYSKKVNRNIHEMPQSQTAANPRHQEEEKNGKKLTGTKQTNAREAHMPAFFPKRGDLNAKKQQQQKKKKKKKKNRKKNTGRL